MTAEIIVILEYQDARSRTRSLAIEVRRCETADTSANYEQVVMLVRVDRRFSA